MKKLLPLIVISFFCLQSEAQVGISGYNLVPDPSAGLDVNFTDKGFLPPRMTTEQIGLISSPANGLVVFCTTDNKFYGYISTNNAWKEILFGASTITPNCGTVTINHVTAGGVAPVDKSVTYGTISGIPGAPSKCLITSNLGADHQATAVNDASEASAGWYWQFNRKQGFRNTGGFSVTPAWTINSINETHDWQAANDPCNLELGTAWRIPTYSEWNNLDNSGNWFDWNGPWNSGLKMHAAGYLANNGGLSFRGEYGYYWSGTQFTSVNGWSLGFTSTVCTMYSSNKPYGLTLRCLRTY